MDDTMNLRPGLLVAFGILAMNGGVAEAAGRFVVGLGVGRAAVDGVTRTDPTPPVALSQLPSEISLNGLPFDDRDVAGRLFVRYEFTPEAGAEVGFWNLGEFENHDLAFGRTATLGASEWYAQAFYRLSLASKLHVKGSIGAAYADFEASGETPIVAFGNSPSPIPPTLIVPQQIYGALAVPAGVVRPFNGAVVGFPVEFPLASPNSEWGMLWGIAVEWQVTERWGLEFGYNQHRIKVQDVESLDLSVTAAF